MSYLQTVNTEFFIKIDAGTQYTGKSSIFSFNIFDPATNVLTKTIPAVTEVSPGLYHASFTFNQVGDYIVEVINNELWHAPQKVYVKIVINSNTTTVVVPGSPIVFKYKSYIQ